MAIFNLFGRKNRIKKQKRKIARTVQQSIPIDAIYKDGIFRTGRLFSKSWKFSDINYAVASDDDQLQMFLAHSAILNGLPTDAMAEITIYNRQLHNKVFEQITTPSDNPNYRKYTKELNGILCDKMSESNNINILRLQPKRKTSRRLVHFSPVWEMTSQPIMRKYRQK